MASAPAILSSRRSGLPRAPLVRSWPGHALHAPEPLAAVLKCQTFARPTTLQEPWRGKRCLELAGARSKPFGDRQRTSALCAKGTAGVDTKRTLRITAADVAA